MSEGISRRDLIVSGSVGGALLSLNSAARAGAPVGVPSPRRSGRAAPAGLKTPNNSTLPWREVGGVKVMHLVAEPVEHEIAPGLVIQAWGYNGHCPGPTIEMVEGDRVRIYVTNRISEPTTVHWHGVFVPNGMDGVSGLTQAPIEPGETFRYEFEVRQHGTFMYHPHFDEMTQMAQGLMGMLIIHPREPEPTPVERDFAIILSEWAIRAGTRRADPSEMTDFSILTMNARAFPGTDPLVVRTGDRVRIRLGNLSAMSHHPIHLHGHRFFVTATDGGKIQESARWPETAVLVPVGSTRTIEFIADAPGDWAMHCHMTHHIMNQMGHGIPNVLGADAGKLDDRIRELVPGYMTMGAEGQGGMALMGMRVPRNSLPMVGGPGAHGYIDMGGMFTVLKVRDELQGDADPGWYPMPEGTLARPATTQELRDDGIDAR
jgi:FtsP/CotA-like multicopper oxidase with cupredoxin domain